MNRFVKTALAVAVVGSAANAGTGDNDWTALDSEISGLASSLKPSTDGMGWSALIRAVYSYSSDAISTGRSGADTSGFNFNDVDLAFWGASGPYSWRLSADLDGNGFEFDNSGFVVESSSQLWLEDAYVRFNCEGYVDTMMGNFKPRVTRSNSVDPEKQLFIDRTALGSAFDSWDMGIGASGAFDLFHWYAALMNGLNGHERDHFYVVRGEFDLGSGAGEYEGAMGSSDTLNATVGLSFVANDTNDGLSLDLDGSGNDPNALITGGGPGQHVRSWILDLNGSVSNVGFGFEVAELDDDFLATTDEDYGNIFDSSRDPMGQTFPFLAFGGDSNPWNATVSYLITSEVEVAARYEDLDNGSSNGPDNQILSVGANWYRQGGKWQAQWTRYYADGAFNDGNVVEVGYSIGSTR